jgi:hypothetical protein
MIVSISESGVVSRWRMGRGLVLFLTRLRAEFERLSRSCGAGPAALHNVAMPNRHEKSSVDVEVMDLVCDTLDVSRRPNIQGCALGGVAATPGYHQPLCQLRYLYNIFTRILSFNMRSYKYLPPDKGSDSVRLLRLLPSEVDKAEIRAELLEYNLRNTQYSRHPYEALSYVWGGLETTRFVSIGNEELGITPNLYAALLRLRDVNFPRTLWVDAVCINQSDIAEKEIQIQHMAKIYGYAKCTIAWLGEEANMSNTALEAIRIAGNSPMLDSSTQKKSNKRVRRAH